MDKGFEAWYTLLQELGGTPDLDIPSEEQAAIECFGLDVSSPKKELIPAGSAGMDPSRLQAEPERLLPFAQPRGSGEDPSQPTSDVYEPRRVRDSITVVSWVIVGSIAIVGIVNDLGRSEGQGSIFWASLAHVAFIAAALIQIASDRRRFALPEGARGIVPRVWKQFLLGWTLLWGAWLALYSCLAFSSFMEGQPPTHRWASATAEVIQIVSSYAFLYLFLILDRPSVPLTEHPQRDRDFRTSLAAVQVVCGITAVLSIAGHFAWAPGLKPLAVWTVSLLAAVSMMYFFMGLGYRELRIRRLMLAPLFLYVAIQMLYPVIAGLESSREEGLALPSAELLLWVALILKIHLFRLVTQWIHKGRLIEYLEEVKFPRTFRDLGCGD